MFKWILAGVGFLGMMGSIFNSGGMDHGGGFIFFFCLVLFAGGAYLIYKKHFAKF